jgi:uncharacterized 2Fe-2S/4Fe-4S cluster protein (DUF4445 family)
MGVFDQNHPLVSKNALLIASVEHTGHQRGIEISRKDISEIQLATGAIRAGISLMLNHMHIKPDQLEKIVLAGAFGTYLNINSAKAIGLVPSVEHAEIIQIGNAAGIGAKQVLISSKKRRDAIRIKNSIDHLELSNHPEFTAEFAKAMRFP